MSYEVRWTVSDFVLEGGEGSIIFHFGDGRLISLFKNKYLSLCLVKPGEEDKPFSLESVCEVNREDSAECVSRSNSRQICITPDLGDWYISEVTWFGKFKEAGEFQAYIIISDHPEGVNIDWLVASGAFHASTCHYTCKFVSQPFTINRTT